MNIAIVNDSILAVEAIRRAVTSDPRHHVLWIARNGIEAVEKCRVKLPELILMDMIMPQMDGVTATRQIMEATPCPILVVTASVRTNSGPVFQAMGAGALDAVATPTFDSPAGRNDLLDKIDNLEKLLGPTVSAKSNGTMPVRNAASDCVVVGSSAGGPAALAKILGALPTDFAFGIVVVQHVDQRFALELVNWLALHSTIPVRAATHDCQLGAGEARVAVGADHLVFLPNGRLGYTSQPEDTPYRPSVDALFYSALKHGPKSIIGVLLTGMGRDGSAGLKALRNAGHHTIAQDEASSALYGMPKAAAKIDAATDILPLDRIAARIVQRCGGR